MRKLIPLRVRSPTVRPFLSRGGSPAGRAVSLSRACPATSVNREPGGPSPVGIGVSAATANLSADILAFSRSKGLYGGVSLDGAVIAVRGGLNNGFYGRAVSPADILVRHDAANPDGKRLSEAVAKAASEATARGDCTGGSVEKGKGQG